MNSRQVLLIPLAWLALALCFSCGGDAVELETIKGKVIGSGLIEGALVCGDRNANGRCDEDELQTRSDATGAYQLTIPKEPALILLAEIEAGRARDADSGGATVDVSYRMASASNRYSSNITPYSTLVHFAAQADFRLAEDEVRDTIGLPPKFNINLGAPAASGTLTQAVGKAVLAALQTTGMALDLSAPDALNQVIAVFPPALTELPQLRIDTKDKAPIVSKEIYVNATFQLTNPVLPNQSLTLNGKIRGRGHSTWGQPKNPYKVQFSNDSAYAAVPDFLGMSKNRNWALMADYFDRSLIRNKLALSLGNSSVFADGLKWTPSGQHIEVHLNDVYVGVYLMTEDIRIDPVRLNIKKMSSKATDNDIDGGYIVEQDVGLNCYNDGIINLQHISSQGVPFCIDTPDEGAITPNQISYIKNQLDSVEQDIFGQSSTARINPVSYADWYLLQELFRNNDAVFWSSNYMWKDTDSAVNPADRLLNMGPIWDFDRSAGNDVDNDNWKTEGCWVAKSPPYYTPWWPNWTTRLLDIPQFRDLVLTRWKQKRAALEKFINSAIDSYARRLELPQQRNFAVWPIFDVHLTNYYVFATHAEEVAFVRSFLNERLAWLDKAYASSESFDALCK